MDNGQKNTPTASKRLRLSAPAKVNLFLRVIFKRPDGYHEISTLMQPVSLYDELTIDVGQGEGISVESDHHGVPGGSENLAYKAADLVLTEAGLKRSVSIFIKKNIPIGAGLGGGSSDAACVLTGVNASLGDPLSEARLMELGASIGSDVPFFVLKSPALATGRGEVLKRVTLPRFTYLLVNPGFQVSTAWVYNNLDLTKNVEDNILMYSETALDCERNIKDLLYNDLETVTTGKHPEISAIKGALVEAGAIGALMSGSGPTVFGIFSEPDRAKAALEKLKVKFGKDFFLFLAHGL